MPSYEMTGTVKLITEQQTFDSGFTKQEFVVTTDDDKYPQDVKFECIKDKIELLSGVMEGQKVNVSFNVRGNEYQGRYFVSLTCWKLDHSGNGQMPDDGWADIAGQIEDGAGGDDDNLPF